MSGISGKCCVLLLVHRFHASRCQQCTLCSTNSTGSRRPPSKCTPPCLLPVNTSTEWTSDSSVTALVCDVLIKETIFHSHIIYQLVLPTLVRELETVGKGKLCLLLLNSGNWESSAYLFTSQWACNCRLRWRFSQQVQSPLLPQPLILGCLSLNSFTRNMRLI